MTPQEMIDELRAGPLSGNPVFEEAADLIESLQAALRYGVGAAMNDLVARGFPLEWSGDSGIGRMLMALGCRALCDGPDVRAVLDRKD